MEKLIKQKFSEDFERHREIILLELKKIEKQSIENFEIPMSALFVPFFGPKIEFLVKTKMVFDFKFQDYILKNAPQSNKKKIENFDLKDHIALKVINSIINMNQLRENSCLMIEVFKKEIENLKINCFYSIFLI